MNYKRIILLLIAIQKTWNTVSDAVGDVSAPPADIKARVASWTAEHRREMHTLMSVAIMAGSEVIKEIGDDTEALNGLAEALIVNIPKMIDLHDIILTAPVAPQR